MTRMPGELNGFKGDDMFNLTLAEWWLFGIFGIWQILGIVLLIILVIFWLQYRKRQM